MTGGRPSSDGGAGKTTAEMQTAATFLEAGWDLVGESENAADDIRRILEGQGAIPGWSGYFFFFFFVSMGQPARRKAGQLGESVRALFRYASIRAITSGCSAAILFSSAMSLAKS